VSIGFDINIQYIKKAKNKQINLIIASATEPPFKETTIDIYFINEVLEHINKDIKVISEAYKIIKRNGLICVYAPNKIYPWETHLRIKKMPSFFVSWMPDFARKKIFKLFKKKYVSIYTRRKLKSLIENKFNIIEIRIVPPSLKRVRNQILYKILNTVIKNIGIFGISIMVLANKN
jgi:ubiquinone/menaquinone biosynthesis C-methylase UbiE